MQWCHLNLALPRPAASAQLKAGKDDQHLPEYRPDCRPVLELRTHRLLPHVLRAVFLPLRPGAAEVPHFPPAVHPDPYFALTLWAQIETGEQTVPIGEIADHTPQGRGFFLDQRG